MRNPNEKIFNSLEEAVAWRNQLSKKSQKLVITNGCFDIMHRGHAQYLFNAREQGDKLLVLINGDDSIQRLKGSSRPVINEENRVYMLASLECVDAVLVFNDDRATNFFHALKPDVYVKGADYCEATLNTEEYNALKSNHATFKFLEFVPGCSTSSIVKRIIETEER